MIIVCPKCSSRLQIDEKKARSRPFTIRCPKCNTSVESGSSSPAVEQSAGAPGGAPASEPSRFEPATPAPLFEFEQKDNAVIHDSSATEKLAELLSGLLTQSRVAGHKAQNGRPSWDPRKALVCVPEESRESIARGLAENRYQVFVAQDTRQAVERMRENQLDVVILDSRFDPAEQGSVFVSREVSILRPAQRRRMFFVLLSPSLRTLDAHAAFLNNANAIVNVNETGELPKLLENQVRAYNELYRDFNSALGLPAL
ncbi:MAG: zinc-ribbon domain-containing protein [Pyrinomonadaceae bacterium]